MIYVDPSFIGMGLGAALHNSAIQAARRASFSRAFLWVLPANARARGFYERNGWTLEGSQREEDFQGFSVQEIRYARVVESGLSRAGFSTIVGV